MNESIEYQAAWEGYANIWKLEGVPAKRAACEAHLAQDCVYRDPLAQCVGWDELIDYMVRFHSDVPGGHFVTTEFLAHHGRSLAYWNMVAGDGTVLDTGASYAEYDGDGRLVQMSGFFRPSR